MAEFHIPIFQLTVPILTVNCTYFHVYICTGTLERTHLYNTMYHFGSTTPIFALRVTNTCLSILYSCCSRDLSREGGLRGQVPGGQAADAQGEGGASGPDKQPQVH